MEDLAVEMGSMALDEVMEVIRISLEPMDEEEEDKTSSTMENQINLIWFKMKKQMWKIT